MAHHPGEESPLLPPKQQPKQTPLPWPQLSILLFLQLSEPLSSQVLNPFAVQLVRDVGITAGDDAKLGYYVGFLQSAFFATQAITVLQWGRFSDYIGRKPVLLIGLAGISLSMYSFGLSKSYSALIFSRALNGALNGNVGVMKSMVGEFTDNSNVGLAFSYMPIAWSTGATLGPLIGGALSKPADRFPFIFGGSSFWRQYPYFLACAVPATYAALAWFVTYFSLKETLPKKLRKEYKQLDTKELDDTDSLLSPSSPQQPPLRNILTRRVLIATLNYAILALVDISYRGIKPLFFATSIPYSGLAMSPPLIGAIGAASGLLNGSFQILYFPRLHQRYGPKPLYILGVLSGFPVFATFPLLSAMMALNGRVTPGAWLVIAVQLVFYVLFNMAFSCIFIYVAASSPTRQTIGLTNNIAQTLVSIMRAIGPIFANSLFSLSIQYGYMGGWLVWWALLSLVVVALLGGLMFPRRVWKRDDE